jgi:hypothetical protein
MISLAVLKANILYCLQTLAFRVQTKDQHRMLKPGEIWWVSSLGDDWRKQYPEAQHICEQLGIAISEMSAAFGKRWTASKTSPFNLFRTRKLGSVHFISVELINEFSDYGSDSLAPHYHETDGKRNSVANKKIHSTALGRLERQVSTSSNLMRMDLIEKANKQYSRKIFKEPTKEPAITTVAVSPASPAAAIPAAIRIPPRDAAPP